MRLKIISDGTFNGTKIVDSQTGEKVEGVTDINWQVNKNDSYGSATIRLRKAELDVELLEANFRLITLGDKNE